DLERPMSWDAALFHRLNQTWTHPWLDAWMPVITSSATWRIPVIAAVLLLLWRGNARARWIVLGVGICVGLSDQISSQLLKPLVARSRPSFVLPDVRLLLSPKYSYSFPSSHAVNLAAVTWFLCRAQISRWGCAPVIVILLVVSYSRIYVGVHYPSDILGGFVIGATIAECVRRWPPLRRRILPPQPISEPVLAPTPSPEPPDSLTRTS
ncbi:MAG TPA: phosphatase PAP2 family protein, partial [Candidatus Eisenbacteria bacterium]|nr:phosphatase PAP2 family protein [Candidatus Eisenbacteria bacterium]